MEYSSIHKSIENIIEFIGDDPSKKDLLLTAERVVKSYDLIFSGYKQNIEEIMDASFLEIDGNDIVMFEKIGFFSICKHHFLPFFGNIQIGYIPNKKIVGFGTIENLVKAVTRKLQIQENIIEEIANTIQSSNLQPKGVFVKIEAEHLCIFSKREDGKPITLKNIITTGDFKLEENLKKLEIILK